MVGTLSSTHVVEEDDEVPETRTFESLGLNPTIVEACKALGFKHPTKIQCEAIPVALQGVCEILGSFAFISFADVPARFAQSSAGPTGECWHNDPIAGPHPGRRACVGEPNSHARIAHLHGGDSGDTFVFSRVCCFLWGREDRRAPPAPTPLRLYAKISFSMFHIVARLCPTLLHPGDRHTLKEGPCKYCHARTCLF